MKRKIVLALTGASGIEYGVRLAEELRRGKRSVLTVIVSDGAREVAGREGVDLKRLGKTLGERDFHAAPASGSALFDAMVVCPCSMKTLSAIANGFSHNLIARAADVALKEGRKLVLVPRETPLNAVHLENMLKLSRLGVVILPACPGFYHKPRDVGGVVDFIVGKVLDSLGFEHDLFAKWGEGK